MRKVLYDIALGAFPILLQVASLFHGKAKLMIDGRKNWKGKLASKNFSGKKIWIHCASLGEFEQGRPLIERIKASHPTYSIIITFFSSSGYEVRKDYAGADYVCYLPFDGPHSSQTFVDLLNPDLAIFVKCLKWANVIS